MKLSDRCSISPATTTTLYTVVTVVLVVWYEMGWRDCNLCRFWSDWFKSENTEKIMKPDSVLSVLSQPVRPPLRTIGTLAWTRTGTVQPSWGENSV